MDMNAASIAKFSLSGLLGTATTAASGLFGGSAIQANGLLAVLAIVRLRPR